MPALCFMLFIPYYAGIIDASLYIIHPVAALILAWVIDRPVQTISLISVKCYILADGIQALPDMYTCGPQAVRHTYQEKFSYPCYNYKRLFFLYDKLRGKFIID